VLSGLEEKRLLKSLIESINRMVAHPVNEKLLNV